MDANEKNELINLIRKYIKKDKYYEFADILEEIFIRRAELFEFSLDEMESQIKNFTNSCDEIKLTSSRKLGRKSSFLNATPLVVGNWNANKKVISINKSTSLSPENFFETITHEVYHAISQKKDGTTGLTFIYLDNPQSQTGHIMPYLNAPFQQMGTALNESFNEVAAFSSVYDKDLCPFIQRTTSEYPTITFVPKLISNSVGLPYKDVIKAGLQDRKTLFDLLLSKFPKEKHADFLDCFEKFEISLDGIHFLEYTPETLTDTRQYILKIQLMKEFYKNIFNTSYDMARAQILADKAEITPKYAKSIENRLDEILKIRANALSTELLFENLRKEDLNEIIKNTSEKYGHLNDAVVAIHEYSRILPDIKDANIQEQLELYARQGDLDKMREIITENNINIKLPIEQSGTDYRKIKYPTPIQKDLLYERVHQVKLDTWNNTNIKALISRAFNPPLNEVISRKLNKLRSSFDNFKIKFQNVIEHKKSLPAETEENPELKPKNENTDENLFEEKRTKFTSSLEVDSSENKQNDEEFSKSGNSHLKQVNSKNTDSPYTAKNDIPNRPEHKIQDTEERDD